MADSTSQSLRDEINRLAHPVAPDESLWDTLHVYADWLEQTGSSVAIGYRLLAVNKRHPKYQQMTYQPDWMTYYLEGYFWDKDSESGSDSGALLPDCVKRRCGAEGFYGESFPIIAYDKAAQAYMEAFGAGEIDSHGRLIVP